MPIKPTDKTLLEVQARLTKAFGDHSEIKVSYRPHARDFLVSRPASAGDTPSYTFFALKQAVETHVKGLPFTVTRVQSQGHHAVVVARKKKSKIILPKPEVPTRARVLYTCEEVTEWGGCGRLHVILPGDKKAENAKTKAEDEEDARKLLEPIDPLELLRIIHLVLKGEKLRAELAAVKLPGARKLMEADESVFLKPTKKKA